MTSAIGWDKAECMRSGPLHEGPLRTMADVEYTTVTLVEWRTPPDCAGAWAT